LGREKLSTGGTILTDIAENNTPEVSPKNIVSIHVTESVQNVIGNLNLYGGKLAKVVTSVTKKRRKAKQARVIKRDIF
jgi:hypothetical protein